MIRWLIEEKWGRRENERDGSARRTYSNVADFEEKDLSDIFLMTKMGNVFLEGRLQM